MRRALLLLLILAPTALARAAPDPGPMLVRTPAGEALLEEGRDLMLAFRLDDAEAAFERLEQTEPASPAARFHLAKIAWWRALMMEQDALYEAFFERSEAALDAVGDAPEGPWRNHLRAEAELHRAAIHAKKAEYTRAALALRQAYNHFERNAERHPDFAESAWGIGIAHAAVGTVPKKFRWVLRLMGFEGTVPQGLREIAVSAERSRYYREEAGAYYALLDLLINESAGGGIDRLAALYRRHPESPALGYLHGYALLNDRQAAEANRVLRAASRAVAADGVYPIPYLDYYRAVALMRLGEYEAAARLYERYLRRFPGRALRAMARVKAGTARELAGDRAAAVAHYRAALDGPDAREDYDGDQEALRRAEDRLANPLAGHRRALLLGGLAFDAGRYDEAAALVRPVLADGAADAVLRAEAAYRSARAYHVQGRLSDALRLYRAAVSNPGDPLAKWGPWSTFYVGEVLAEQGDRAGARRAFERVLANDDPFAYHKALEQRTRAALERLG